MAPAEPVHRVTRMRVYVVRSRPLCTYVVASRAPTPSSIGSSRCDARTGRRIAIARFRASSRRRREMIAIKKRGERFERTTLESRVRYRPPSPCRELVSGELSRNVIRVT